MRTPGPIEIAVVPGVAITAPHPSLIDGRLVLTTNSAANRGGRGGCFRVILGKHNGNLLNSKCEIHKTLAFWKIEVAMDSSMGRYSVLYRQGLLCLHLTSFEFCCQVDYRIEEHCT